MELFLQASREIGVTSLSYIFLVFFIAVYWDCSMNIAQAIINKKNAFIAGALVFVVYQFLLFTAYKIDANSLFF